MKQTSVEHIGRSQLIPGVGPTAASAMRLTTLLPTGSVLSRAKELLASLFGTGNQSGTQRVKMDVVTEHPETGVFALILVETGPWTARTEDADCQASGPVDDRSSGHFADVPKTRGRAVRIQLDTYDIPEGLVRPFFDRFADHVSTWTEVQQAIQAKQNVRSLAFEYNARVIDGDLSQESRSGPTRS